MLLDEETVIAPQRHPMVELVDERSNASDIGGEKLDAPFWRAFTAWASPQASLLASEMPLLHSPGGLAGLASFQDYEPSGEGEVWRHRGTRREVPRRLSVAVRVLWPRLGGGALVVRIPEVPVVGGISRRPRGRVWGCRAP